MLNIDVFSDFISVGAAKGISKLGKVILNQDFSDGMSGYDVEDLVKHVLVENNKTTKILDSFKFDSEYGMFCMYYKNVDGKCNMPITQEDINRCTELVRSINELMKKRYIAAISDLNHEPYISFTKDYLKSK